MSSPLRRRWVSVVALPILTPVLALAGTVVLSSPAEAAGPEVDPLPATVGADWLASQLEDGVLVNRQFGFDYLDYGLTIDAALALDAVGGHHQALLDITAAAAAGVDPYATGAEFDAEGNPLPDDGTYAGPMAKLLTLALGQGADETSFGGFDLVAEVESVVLTDTGVSGRIKDDSSYGDYANVIGQGFAARGLTAAGSDLADEVTAFLLDQQCAGGFFRLTFSAEDAADQTCDGSGGTADSDATALSALALLDVAADPGAGAEVDQAIADATGWLLARQAKNGSLGGGTATEAANTNSTGLAGWVFGEVGRTGAAAKAAAWVRARQADDVAPCVTALSEQTGAIGYDDAGVALGRDEGIVEATRDQWRRATSQALPVLAWAAAGDLPALAAPQGYVQGGTSPQVGLSGLAPGSSVCVTRGPREWPARAGRSGRASLDVLMPKRTKTVTVTARGTEAVLAETTVDVLGRLAVEPRLAKDRVDRRGEQTVRAGGLAPGERVKVRYRGDVVARTTAGPLGNARATFKVGRQPGVYPVTVLGEFPHIRRGSTEFRVR